LRHLRLLIRVDRTLLVGAGLAVAAAFAGMSLLGLNPVL
jgi:hypothetical protein